MVEWLVVLAANPEAPEFWEYWFTKGLPAAGPVAYKSGVTVLPFEKSSLNKA